MFFFFSSRRRHTRYIGDWSSDVCSSDLPPMDAPSVISAVAPHATVCRLDRDHRARDGRSEERRVGEECLFWFLAVTLKSKELDRDRGSMLGRRAQVHGVNCVERRPTLNT